MNPAAHAEYAFSAHRAAVAGGSLRQTEVRVLEGGQVFALASALGPPRLWGYGLDAAFEGLSEGLLRPHDGRLVTRLHQALDAAQTRLKARVDALIERQRCDVGLLALSVEEGRLHVLGVGPVRAYLRRQGGVRRLSARDDRADGLLRARASACNERVMQGDLVVAGSLTAFCDESLQRLGLALAETHDLEPQAVTDLLNKAAVEGRRGVSSLALRIAKV